MRSVSLIAAVADNGVIGRGGALPWRLPDDLARFKRLTMGRALIVGRKTFESIGRALPGRRTIVVTRRRDWSAPGIETAGGLDEAFRLAGDGEAFVAGGAAIYAEAMPRADKLYLTRVRAVIQGDVRFPEFDPREWRLVSSERHEPDARHAHPFTFEEYERTGFATE